MRIRQSPHVLFCFCTDQYWFDVAQKLTHQKVKLDYIISRPAEMKVQIRSKLPNTQIIDQQNLEYPHRLENLNVDNPVVLDRQTLEDLKPTEDEYLSISDRISFFPITVKARRLIFQELVKFWTYFFQLHHIDAVVFTDTPHVGFDTVLFAIAKKLAIKTILPKRTFIADRMLLMDDYHHQPIITPLSLTKNKSIPQLKKMVDPKLLRELKQNNAWQKKDSQITSSIIHRRTLTVGAVIAIGKSWSPINIYKYCLALFSQSTSGGFNLNNGQLLIVEKLSGYYHRWHLAKQRNFYESLCQEPESFIHQKYIYFPLHFQPERSTTPEGGLFENQLLAVAILANSIPKGWKICVKEHPRQFRIFDFHKHSFRSMAFYRKLASFPQLVLCSVHTPQQLLVKQAQMTATVTGTGGWESLLLRKPAITFGHTWYSSCRSCIQVGSAPECKRAIQQLMRKTKSEVWQDVLGFLIHSQSRLIEGSNSFEFANWSKRPYQQLVDNMAKGIMKRLR